MGLCVICGKMATEKHHLIFGQSCRNLCEKDKAAGIVVPICRECHTTGKYRIHDNPVAEALSKMLGQALWERWYLTDFGDADRTSQQARDNFIRRYGRNWL